MIWRLRFNNNLLWIDKNGEETLHKEKKKVSLSFSFWNDDYFLKANAKPLAQAIVSFLH